MKAYRWLNLILVMVFISACGSNGSGVPGLGFLNTPTLLPTPVAHITPAPDPQITVNAYLDALKNNDYASMYSCLLYTSDAADE